MKIPCIDNGKNPREHLHVKHMLPLPSNTPFGNMGLKHTKIVQRIDFVNLKIEEVYENYETIKTEPYSNPSYHLFLSEEVIYWLRKSADELISLLYLFYCFSKNSTYPDHIEIDSIGKLLHSKDENFKALFQNHLITLNVLNEVSNAHKHSFINSDMNIIGRDYPCVPALSLQSNNLSKETRFYNVSLEDIVVHFNEFYQTVVERIKRNDFSLNV